MRTVILAICLGAASAFMGAPVAHRAAGKSSMSMVAKSPAEVGNQGGMDELGITSPIGYWDPWGFNTSPEKFYRYRQVELKHGRIAQAAMLGLLVQENFRFPGAIDLEGTQFADIPNGPPRSRGPASGCRSSPGGRSRWGPSVRPWTSPSATSASVPG